MSEALKNLEHTPEQNKIRQVKIFRGAELPPWPVERLKEFGVINDETLFELTGGTNEEPINRKIKLIDLLRELEKKFPATYEKDFTHFLGQAWFIKGIEGNKLILASRNSYLNLDDTYASFDANLDNLKNLYQRDNINFVWPAVEEVEDFKLQGENIEREENIKKIGTALSEGKEQLNLPYFFRVEKEEELDDIIFDEQGKTYETIDFMGNLVKFRSTSNGKEIYTSADRFISTGDYIEDIANKKLYFFNGFEGGKIKLQAANPAIESKLIGMGELKSGAYKKKSSI